ANSWEHSYQGKRGKLRLEMERRGGEVEVRITDWGVPFRPEEVPIPHIAKDLDQVNLDGLGMLVMRKAMDELSFSTHPQKGNTVTMRKRLGAKKRATSRPS
ncbi:MAG: ATP-binding protein, partial [Chloroflexi bacterium]|nr:ATP-binding protein [Chloroflexota bacterium]